MEAFKKTRLCLYSFIYLLIILSISQNIMADGPTVTIAAPPEGMRIVGPVDVKAKDEATTTKFQVASKPSATPTSETLVFTGNPKISCKLHEVTEHMPVDFARFLWRTTEEIPVVLCIENNTDKDITLNTNNILAYGISIPKEDGIRKILRYIRIRQLIPFIMYIPILMLGTFASIDSDYGLFNPLLWTFAAAGAAAAKFISSRICQNWDLFAQELEDQCANTCDTNFLVPSNGGKREVLVFVTRPNIQRIAAGNLLPQLKYSFV